MPGSLLYLAMAAVAAAAWGGASPPKPTGSDGTFAGGRQTIHVEVANREPEGTQPLYLPRTESIVLLPGTNCSLSNDRGEWAFVTPADVSVELSEAPLRLHCRREGYPEVNRTLPCVTPRSEAMKAGVMASLRLASIAPAAAPVALGVGAAGVLLYFAAAAAAGAAAGSPLSGPDADICRYSLSGAIQVVMAGPPPEANSAQAGPGQAAAQPWEIDPALSNPTSLADIVNGGRGTIVYSHTAPGGVTSHRAALRPSDGVLLALPQGYILDVNHGMAALAGVRFSPPVPIVGKSLSPGAKWSHAGSLEEAGGLARAETTRPGWSSTFMAAVTWRS